MSMCTRMSRRSTRTCTGTTRTMRTRWRTCSAPLEAACAATGPFPVELDHLGRFARSDVVWAGPSGPPEAGLPALHAALRRACAGVPIGRPAARFSPHVTLLRGAEPDVEAPADPVGPWRWTADRFVLMRTDPSPKGRVYTPLGEWRLRADRA